MKTFDVTSAASNLLVLFSFMIAVAAMLLGDKLTLFLSTVAVNGVVFVGELPRFLQTLLG